MKCEIDLEPSGNLRLSIPDGRSITLGMNVEALRLIQRILYHTAQHEDHHLAFPTQFVIDAWERGRKIDWSRREPAVVRTVVKEPVKAKPASKKRRKTDMKMFNLGIDLTKIEFTL